MKYFLSLLAVLCMSVSFQVTAKGMDCNGPVCVSMEQVKDGNVVTYFGQRLILNDDKVCTWSMRVRVSDGVVLDRRTNCTRVER